jgi:hypothetical protein
MAVNYGSLPFAEQIAFFLAKALIPTERWNDLQREMHDTGFMVAGALKADLLADLKGAMQKAISDGTTLAEFRKDFDKIVAKHGWTGWTGSDSKAGVAWRTRVIYDTNLRSSYQAGRWQQIQAGKIHRPYLIYKHSHAVITPRAEHLAWDGLVVPVDSDWVKTHYPPNGYGCQCTMFALSARDLIRRGKTGPDTPPDDGAYDWTDKKTGEIHTFPVGIQPFWDYTPGASLLVRAQEQIARKLESLPADIAKQLAAVVQQGPAAKYEQAAQALGVKSADYAQREDIAGIVNGALAALADKGLALPDHIRVDEERFLQWEKLLGESLQDAPAAFTASRASRETYLFLRPSDAYWLDAAGEAARQYAKQRWSTGRPDHAVIHEMGHLAHYRHAPASYANLLQVKFTAEQAATASKVGFYAATEPREFVAETFVLLTVGAKIDEDVLKLYRLLGGVLP